MGNNLPFDGRLKLCIVWGCALFMVGVRVRTGTGCRNYRTLLGGAIKCTDAQED